MCRCSSSNIIVVRTSANSTIVRSKSAGSIYCSITLKREDASRSIAGFHINHYIAAIITNKRHAADALVDDRRISANMNGVCPGPCKYSVVAVTV